MSCRKDAQNCNRAHRRDTLHRSAITSPPVHTMSIETVMLLDEGGTRAVHCSDTTSLHRTYQDKILAGKIECESIRHESDRGGLQHRTCTSTGGITPRACHHRAKFSIFFMNADMKLRRALETWDTTVANMLSLNPWLHACVLDI